MTVTPAARLVEERARVRVGHAAGASGLATARALSDAVDEAVRSIWHSAGATGEVALVAVGGYGRREMSPHSDVDLIVLHGRRAEVAGAAKALSYQLWDAGMDAAPSVHTAAEGLRLAGERLDSLTAFLDARLVTGDPSLFSGFVGRVREGAARPAGETGGAAGGGHRRAAGPGR